MAEPIKLDGSGSPADKTPPPLTKLEIGGSAGPSSGVGASSTAASTTATTAVKSSTTSTGGPATTSTVTDLFSQSNSKGKESKMVNSILAQKESLQKMKPILGPAPTLEKSLQAEKEARLRKKLRSVRMMFVMVLLLGLGSAFYFYSELSPDFHFFGANTMQRLSDMNATLRTQQAKLNKYRYLSAQLALNEFSYQSDRFFGNLARLNDPTLSPGSKDIFLAEVKESEKAMPSLLEEIRTSLNKDLVVKLYPIDGASQMDDEQIQAQFEEELRNNLREDRKKISPVSTSPEDVQNMKLYDNALRIVGNQSLLSTLRAINIDNFKKDLAELQTKPDVQKEKALRDMVGKILVSTKSDLATMADIKQNRIDWTTVIQYIEAETAKVDTHYGDALLYETLGGITYSGYEFDAVTHKIVLSGTTKTIDGSNFTLMSNLIDQLEQSSYFEDVDMRSFSKSKTATGTSTEGYNASFKIDLRLEPEKSIDSQNKPISLETESGVKRKVKRTIVNR